MPSNRQGPWGFRWSDPGWHRVSPSARQAELCARPFLGRSPLHVESLEPYTQPGAEQGRGPVAPMGGQKGARVRAAGRGGARRGGAGKSGGRGPARLTLHGFASGEGGLAASDSEGEWTRKQRRRGLRLGRPEPDPGGGGPGGDAQGSAAGCDYGTLLGARGLELELRARSGLGGCVGPRPASGSLAGQEQSLSPGAEASGVLEASWARPGGLAVGRRSVCRWYPSP